ncbi:MAG: alpha/beta hydrolase domain-containing protein [Acidimicrobiales bacterium]
MPIRSSLIIVLAAAALLATSCSDDTGADIDGESAPTTVTPATTSSVPAVVAAVTGPIVTGDGPILPQPATPLPEGYVEEEYFIGGTATSYETVGEWGLDGQWEASPGETADYETRVIVRRPPAERFSGTVVVEWLNVTAVEASPDWGYLVEEIGISGHTYVAVSAQALGVIGGESLIPVEVDAEAAATTGEDVPVPAAGGLVGADPARYGTLAHPGDAYAFDIYTQVGAAVAAGEGGLLGGESPSQVLAIGESQSAGFLTTYVNAIHPRTPVYDGFFVHSRGAGGAPLGGRFGDDTSFVDEGARIRTDLDVPVFMLEAETDLTLLGYTLARQDDTDLIRTWEAAGTAHADAHVIRSILGGPRDASSGSFLGCANPINTGPHHEIAQAAFRHFVGWAAGGAAPPAGARIETTDTEPVAIVRDELGRALGGVRNPLVDVPVVITTGEPWAATDLGGESGIDVCALFGQTIAIERAGLLDLHGSAEGYLAAFDESAAAAVAAGFLLDHDADQLREEARANTGLFE